MRFERLGTVLFALMVLAGCANDGEVDATAPSATTAASSSVPGGSVATPTSGVDSLDQPAIWPASSTVFTTPEDAAADFVSIVLGIPVALGEFRQGDARSGEIEVFSRAEDGAPTVARGLLLLRQIGPTDGWYVLGAASEHATISTPATMAQVPAGPLTVAGVARGFEGAISVRAFLPGEDDALDEAYAQAGAAETPEPYEVTLDLSGASPGDVVAILVRGGTGLETDPGDFGAIVVVVSS